MKFEKSQALHNQAQKFLIGGVNSPVRSFARVGRHPILASRAQGPHLWDVDGNEYIDLVMSYGPHLLGHLPEEIVSSLKETLKSGMCFGMTSEAEFLWAEAALKKIPSAERIRAMNSGTEACMTAIRLARGYTQRDVIVKFSGHYHGHIDSLLVDSGSGVATLSSQAVADSAGLPKNMIADIRVLEFNNTEKLKELFFQEGDKIAGVILEPVMGNMGVIPGEKSFLNELRNLCTQNGALLIFDEVMTGFRVHPHSTQGLFDITPDLSCFGKVVGGGMPLSALAGPQKIMEHLAPLGSVYQAGTLSGNPMAIQAGLSMLKVLEKSSPYENLENLGAQLQKTIEEAAQEKGLALKVQRVGSMLSIFFRENAVKNAQDSRDVDMELFKKFFWSALENGIMLPPSPFEAYFLATAHKSVEAALNEKMRAAILAL